jgi:hypothetical protein
MMGRWGTEKTDELNGRYFRQGKLWGGAAKVSPKLSSSVHSGVLQVGGRCYQTVRPGATDAFYRGVVQNLP